MTTVKDLMSTEFTKLDSNDHVSVFLGTIKKTHQAFGLVFEGKKYVGFADKKELFKTRMDATQTKIKHCIKHVPILTKNTDLKEATRLMIASDVKALPVQDGKKVTGIVTAKKIIQELQPFYKTIPVKDVASKKFFICNETDMLSKAITIMTQKKADRLPVINKDGKLTGIVCMIDILLKYSIQPKTKVKLSRATSQSNWGLTGFQTGEKQNVLKCPISNQMSEITTTCNPNDKTSSAIQQMLDQNINSIIVTENQKPVGVIAYKDIMEYYLRK